MELIWGWIIIHIPDAIKIVTGLKLFADTADSVKKLAPPKLEVKDAAQNYLEETRAVVKDQNITIEERQLEADTRAEIAESMVKLTGIEAVYNIARYAIFTSFTAFTLHLFARYLISNAKRTKLSTTQNSKSQNQ